MEYIFTTSDSYGTLETKGKSHTDLFDHNTIKHKVNGKTTIDSFRAVAKLGSTEDSEYCYDYYDIDYFNRETDEYLDDYFGTVEDAMCEEDEYIDERLSAIEDVLCEFDEKLNGGESYE